MTPADLIALRARAKLTQEQMAKHCGVAIRTYQRWEKGQFRMPAAAWELANLKLRSK